MVTIQLYWKETGSPAKGVKVGIHQSMFDGMHHEYTDSSGEANFSNVSPSDGEVYADGITVYKGRLEGRKLIYI